MWQLWIKGFIVHLSVCFNWFICVFWISCNYDLLVHLHSVQSPYVYNQTFLSFSLDPYGGWPCIFVGASFIPLAVHWGSVSFSWTILGIAPWFFSILPVLLWCHSTDGPYAVLFNMFVPSCGTILFMAIISYFRPMGFGTFWMLLRGFPIVLAIYFLCIPSWNHMSGYLDVFLYHEHITYNFYSS